ncbi:MAG: Hsp20/alpha crystallin family protein [Thermodesulfobacteriota bacterium]
MLGLTIYDPFKALTPGRNFLSWFFGPSILEGLEEADRFVEPKVDVTEEEKSYKVTAELPGFNKDEIKVEIEDGRLELKAEHVEDVNEEKKNYRLRERRSRAFSRTFLLPDNVAGEKIEAGLANGVLTITLPKTEEVKPKPVEIKVN